jgi:hypothetical protein
MNEQRSIRVKSFKEKIRETCRRAAVAATIFLSATLLAEGLLGRQQEKFVKESLNRNGVSLRLDYNILAKDSLSKSDTTFFERKERGYGQNIFVRQGPIEIEVNLEQRVIEDNTNMNDPYTKREYKSSLRGEEDLTDISVYFSVVKSNIIRASLGGISEKSKGNYNSNSIEKYDNNNRQIVSTSEYEHNLLGPGWKIGVDLPVLGVKMPIRVEGKLVEGKSYNSNSYYDSIWNSQYLGIRKDTLRRYEIELNFPFIYYNALINPYYKRTSTDHIEYDKHTEISDVYGIEARLNLMIRKLPIWLGFDYKIKNTTWLSERYEGKYQEQSGKVSVGIEF